MLSARDRCERRCCIPFATCKYGSIAAAQLACRWRCNIMLQSRNVVETCSCPCHTNMMAPIFLVAVVLYISLDRAAQMNREMISKYAGPSLSTRLQPITALHCSHSLQLSCPSSCLSRAVWPVTCNTIFPDLAHHLQALLCCTYSLCIAAPLCEREYKTVFTLVHNTLPASLHSLDLHDDTLLVRFIGTTTLILVFLLLFIRREWRARLQYTASSESREMHTSLVARAVLFC